MYENRSEAGRRLATRLLKFRDRNPIVLALPRGGVPVAFEVARALGAPLDVLVARKIGAPGNPEVGIGAIAEGGALYLDDDLISELGVTSAYLGAATRTEADEVLRRLWAYRRDRPPLDVAGRTVIVVDDGLATGSTSRAAVRALRRRSPREIILAVPVGARETAQALRAECDEVLCASMPSSFGAVGLWYRDFEQTTDEEVVSLLARAERERVAALTPPEGSADAPPPSPTGRTP